MLDGFVWIVPLLLLPIYFLFRFTGCEVDRSGLGPAPDNVSYVVEFPSSRIPDGTGAFVIGIRVTYADSGREATPAGVLETETMHQESFSYGDRLLTGEYQFTCKVSSTDHEVFIDRSPPCTFSVDEHQQTEIRFTAGAGEEDTFSCWFRILED